MCNVNDDPFHSVKREILEKTKDPTAIWMVTPENRNIALLNYVISTERG